MSTQLFGHVSPPAPDSALSVFINCPFDREYEPLLNAIIYTTVCCGFHPRTSISEGTDILRMDRILDAIFTSDYSIHDFSRFRGEGEQGLARFNMPLELGMAVGRRFVSERLATHNVDLLGDMRGMEAFLRDLSHLRRRHRWLLLVPDGAESHRFVSDLAGYDLKSYDGQVRSIVPRVMSWLLAQPGAVPVGGPDLLPVLSGLEKFQAEMAALKSMWAGEVRWVDILASARRSMPRL